MSDRVGIERAVVFGSHHGLVGVLTEPTNGASDEPRAVVVSNIGHHHRVGPFRLYVELARRLAASGWHTLRFDLSGHGDSASRPGAMSDDDAATLDVGEAIDWLVDRYGVRRVVLVGLCSGVASTHAVALTDPRVNGAVFIDGYSYPTGGFYLRAYTLRYLQPTRWIRYARRRLFPLTAGGSRVPSADARTVAPILARQNPPREQFRRDIACMTARRTRLLFVFTGSTYYRYNGRSQIFETLGATISTDYIEVAQLPRADHLFTGLDHRAQFLDVIEDWLRPFNAMSAQPSPLPSALVAEAGVP